MNSNEQIYNTAGSSTDAEPDKLPDLLKNALTEAYPDPGGKIAASVMAQIRAEREAAEKERRAARAEARRRRQGLFMKWGGMAACMMILCGALVIAAPFVNRSDDITVEDAAAEQKCLTTDMTAEKYADAAEEALADEPAEADTFTFTAENEVTEEAAMTKSAPLKQMASEKENEAVQEGGGSVVLYSAVLPAAAAMDAAAEEAYDPAAENEAFLQYLLDEGRLNHTLSLPDACANPLIP